jgi:hypothetical protein
VNYGDVNPRFRILGVRGSATFHTHDGMNSQSDLNPDRFRNRQSFRRKTST